MVKIRQGKMQFGAEMAKEPGYLINRTAGASLYGEPLMCDICNTTYDSDADEGGAFGNGITPDDDPTWTHQYLVVPYAICQEAGVAVGSRVKCVFEGNKVKALVSSGAALARAAVDHSNANRAVAARLGAKTLAIRCVGYTVQAHGGTGTELISIYFDGLHNIG